MTTGLRLGELLGLKWGDVDFENSRLMVRRTLQRQRGVGLTFIEPKTGQSRRTVILSQRALTTLRKHRVNQTGERLAAGPEWQHQDLVFCNVKGGPLDPGGVSVGFTRALKRANLPHVRFHDLRHTAASLLLQVGMHPKLVSDMLGHSTVSITLDLYSHVTPAMHAEAARAMDQMLGG